MLEQRVFANEPTRYVSVFGKNRYIHAEKEEEEKVVVVVVVAITFYLLQHEKNPFRSIHPSIHAYGSTLSTTASQLHPAEFQFGIKHLGLKTSPQNK